MLLSNPTKSTETGRPVAKLVTAPRRVVTTLVQPLPEGGKIGPGIIDADLRSPELLKQRRQDFNAFQKKWQAYEDRLHKKGMEDKIAFQTTVPKGKNTVKIFGAPGKRQVAPQPAPTLVSQMFLPLSNRKAVPKPKTNMGEEWVLAPVTNTASRKVVTQQNQSRVNTQKEIQRNILDKMSGNPKRKSTGRQMVQTRPAKRRANIMIKVAKKHPYAISGKPAAASKSPWQQGVLPFIKKGRKRQWQKGAFPVIKLQSNKKARKSRKCDNLDWRDVKVRAYTSRRKVCV